MQAGGKGRAGVRAVGAIGHEKFARQLWGREILSIMLIRALIPLRLDYFDNSTLNFSHASSGKTDSFNAFCWTVAALRKWSEPLRVDKKLSNADSWREVHEEDQAALRPGLQDISISRT